MIFTGKVKHISALVTVGKDDKKMDKRVICLEENDPEKEHPQKLAIDFVGDRLAYLDGVSEGDVVAVYYNTSYNRFQKD